MRHGQEMRSGSLDPSMNGLGQTQCLMASNFINEISGGFQYLSAIWSSNLSRSCEGAAIVKKMVAEIGVIRSPVPVVQNHLLAEFIPPYPYRVDDSVERAVTEQVERDGFLMEEGRWLVSAALRGAGILVPEKKKSKHSTSCSTRMFGTRPQDLFETCRLPLLHQAMKHKAISSGPEHRAPTNYVYCGHSNTIRYQIFEELGFPRHFWRLVAVPHGAVMIVGLLHSGKPAMIIGDAAYLTATTPVLPITFSPHVRGPLNPDHSMTYRDKLLTDENVTIMKEEQWYGRFAAPGVSYNAPPEADSPEKIVLLIRAGHNRLDGSEDMGLTTLGVRQVEVASHWLGKLVMSNRMAKVPSKWCTGGLTSQFSTIDKSLKQSILLLTKTMEQYLGKDTFDEALVKKEKMLHPQQLFSPAAGQHSTLYAVVADDYHLLKYFGACFGVDPTTLRNLFWPHAGYVAISVTETGWPELRIFGNVSFMEPEFITVFPGSPSRQEIERYNARSANPPYCHTCQHCSSCGREISVAEEHIHCK
eukprot:Selendium_serpulae@DN5349_c0_g1_i4.p1